MKGEYTYPGTGDLAVTRGMSADWAELGYVLVRGLLPEAELARLRQALETDQGGVMSKAYSIGDGDSSTTRICVWNHPGRDITGMVGRSHKVASTMEALLGGEVYHYHTKLMMKDPGPQGGQFLWHQDYGYWYNNGVLRPDMGTVFIALDPCTSENGCLQVIPGSHLCGRVEHAVSGGQMAADAERVDHVLEAAGGETTRVEMRPGDALFFHSNLLHKSSANLSPQRRWAFLCCYNRADNNPVKKHHHPRYRPLEKVANTAILECGTDLDITGKGFILQADPNVYDGGFKVEDDHLN